MIFTHPANIPPGSLYWTLIATVAAGLLPLIFGGGGGKMGRRECGSVANRSDGRWAGRPPQGREAVMNKWILAAVLIAVAVFMYVSIIVKMS